MSHDNNKTVIVASESPKLYTSKRLMTEALKLHYSSFWLNPYQHLLNSTEILLIKDQQAFYFHRTTGIRYDDFDLLVSEHHQQNGFIISNPLTALEIFRDKARQSLFFSRHKLPSIKTINYRGNLSEKQVETLSELSPNHKFILKMIRGNQGIGVNLINGLPSLKSLLETFLALKDQKFLIQPFIEHHKEWRIFIIKGEIVGIIERTLAQDDFRGNSKRSIGKFLKNLPIEIEFEIMRGVQLSGLDYCGVDILSNEDGFFILEFNPVPGFEQLEELGGINIAKELLIKI